MKNITLSIPAPCSENWSNFTPTNNGAHCSTCSKTVIDFTKMSDSEVIAFFANQSTRTCGRFRTDQLKTYSPLVSKKINPGFSLVKVGLLSLLVITFSQPVFAKPSPKANTEFIRALGEQVYQNLNTAPDQLVKGTVISDEDKQPLAGVNIYLKGVAEGTATDANGHFEFPRKLKEGDVLVFSFIGLATQEYIVTKEEQVNLQIRMMYDATIVMGKVAVSEVYAPEPTGVNKWWQKVKALF